MEIATYSLKQGDNSSDKYYEYISKFTDEVIDKIESETSDVLDDFMDYVSKAGYEKVRTRYEYEVEFLVLGVLWNEYAKKAAILKNSSFAVLSYLADIRQKNSVVKKFADFGRGIFETSVLVKEENNLIEIEKSIENVNKLIKWLSAAGDFKYYVKRLLHWRDFFEILKDDVSREYISIASKIAFWFEKRSSSILDYYTKGVDAFLKNEYLKHKWKEDFIFCGCQKVQYHLNMVGAEILNRAFRDDFLKTQEKRLMLPACMRFHNDKSCKAYKTSNGYVCRNCTFDCNVNKLTQMGKKYGFTVYIVFHESVLFTNEKIQEKNIGIIGVACVLNLISGGLKAKEYGFVPQCVLLDYCGCKRHWQNDGLMTEINILRLKEVLGLN